MEIVRTGSEALLEDRRPGANCDPYRVCTLLLETICGDSDSPLAIAS